MQNSTLNPKDISHVTCDDEMKTCKNNDDKANDTESVNCTSNHEHTSHVTCENEIVDDVINGSKSINNNNEMPNDKRKTCNRH